MKRKTKSIENPTGIVKKALLERGDFDTVAEALAGIMLDLYRVCHPENLNDEQNERLQTRLKFNCRTVENILNESASDPIRIVREPVGS